MRPHGTQAFWRRPDPDALLAGLKQDESEKSGRLKIFFGYAAGVGKTYAMLDEARELLKCGVDVIIGYIEPHTRPETTYLAEGLPHIPPKVIAYRNMTLREFDLDAALSRKPQLILVDELAHTNAAGVRNRKRYQDVEELLNAGIDVFTTVNVQHIESLNDIVENITKVKVQETVPDAIFERADKIKLVDVEPDELLRRFEEGKVYRPEQAERARRNFFVVENLRLLREFALRKAADRIGYDNQTERHTAEKMASTRFLVCIGSSPSSARCIRWTARAAEAFPRAVDSALCRDAGQRYFSREQQETCASIWIWRRNSARRSSRFRERMSPSPLRNMRAFPASPTSLSGKADVITQYKNSFKPILKIGSSAFCRASKYISYRTCPHSDPPANMHSGGRANGSALHLPIRSSPLPYW